MKLEKEIIDDLLYEAQANLRLYTSGQDDYAIERYHQLMEQIRNINNAKNEKQRK